MSEYKSDLLNIDCKVYRKTQKGRETSFRGNKLTMQDVMPQPSKTKGYQVKLAVCVHLLFGKALTCKITIEVGY